MTKIIEHLFVTQDFGPDRGGMARRHVELCRRFDDGTNEMEVSTVMLDGAAAFDRGESYAINRQPFYFNEANRFANQVKWANWLTAYAHDSVDVIHCGNIRPVGYAVSWAHSRLKLPYIVYVNGGDLLREQMKAEKSALKRATARRILGQAAGIAATSTWVADLTRSVMEQVAVKRMPPIAALDLGTDPEIFSPYKDTGRLRAKWRVGSAPVMLTVARLVPHKGQDTGIRVLAALSHEFPELRYVLVGEGHFEPQLRVLADQLGVEDRVVFAGAISDSDLPEAYATSTVYLGPSRVDNAINVEGFGISFLEASASGLPVVAGDSGGVRSAVRDGITGCVVPPLDVDRMSASVAGFLRDEGRRLTFGSAGRNAVETHYNWDRVARDTREFTLSVLQDAK
ncbi:MAG TPA: glycosyltransferase family 4 protein [Gemmatimonadaceae bacterium]|nr:glycosyltransferase family 4 protein [Gemmatimonadaceae bacterium]